MAANPSGVTRASQRSAASQSSKGRKSEPQTPGADSRPAAGPPDASGPGEQPKAENPPEIPPAPPRPERDARRDERAKLQAELATKKCALCQAVGCWNIMASPKPAPGERKVRYLKCTACGRTDKLVM